MLRAVAVFCGARAGADPHWAEGVAELGRELARRGLRLVFGGGRVGLMGTVADACLAEGGEVVGVIPAEMAERELAHRGLSRLELVSGMHARKARMAALADAFIAAPGGFGTLDEILEAITWTQLGLQAKPCGFLDLGGFFAPLAAQLDRMCAGGFIEPEHRAMLVFEPTPAALLDRLAALRVPRPRRELAAGRGLSPGAG
ncbi:MAG: TIGR00730 family Rossman fold protein [Xanthomonadales bacterium]|nr:TIGR00730 family Rossman fold protein [Xanthomonadales bacterium]